MTYIYESSPTRLCRYCLVGTKKQSQGYLILKPCSLCLTVSLDQLAPLLSSATDDKGVLVGPPPAQKEGTLRGDAVSGGPNGG